MRGCIPLLSGIRTSLTLLLPVLNAFIVLALIASIEVAKSASLAKEGDASLSPAASPLSARESCANYQANSELVESSKRAIIETGFSEKYFDEHFHLVNAVDKPGDIRVVWRFSIREYEVSVTDSIGYYTKTKKKIYVHSFRNTHGSTRNIAKPIP